MVKGLNIPTENILSRGQISFYYHEISIDGNKRLKII